MAKTLNARVQTKHDIENNWNQAINFIPKPGEIVIYERDRTSEQVQESYTDWQTKLAVANAITNKESEEYLSAAALATEAENTYNKDKTRIVARFKVGDGTTKLIDLPFTNEPFTLKEQGKQLSDFNYDERAHDIVEGIKKFEDTTNDSPQYTDTKYTSGIGLSLVADTTLPPSSQHHTFHNTGVLSARTGIDNGTIIMESGIADGTTTSTSVAVAGLGSAAYTASSSYATAAQGESAEQSVKGLFTPTDVNGAIGYYSLDLQGNQTNTTVSISGLGTLAFKDALTADDLTELPIFTGATKTPVVDETTGEITGYTYVAGERGLVPAPAEQQDGYVLSGNGSWVPIGNVAFNIAENGGLNTTADGHLYNLGLISVAIESDETSGEPQLVFTKYDENFNIIKDSFDFSTAGGSGLTEEQAKKLNALPYIVMSNEEPTDTDVQLWIDTSNFDGTISLNSPFNGASAGEGGRSGLVPAPEAGQQHNVLFGDGNWKPFAQTFTPTLTAGGWSAEVPYIQTVNLTGLSESDTPIADLDLSTASSVEISERKDAWNLVDKIDVNDGKITAYCYTDKPTVDLPLNLLVVK